MHRDNVDVLWEKTLRSVEHRLNNLRAFNTWIKPVILRDFSDKTLTIEVPSMMFEKSFSAYENIIREEFFKLSNIEPRMKIVYGSSHRENDNGQVRNQAKNSHEFKLNPGYTFDNFVVANSNRLAHASAIAVAQSPGIAYNPLFVYGGFGLGKTHLIQAIGQFVKERGEENIKIVYIPAEIFVNEFIQSIKDKKTSAFRDKFRNLDFLILDDIHFIAGKEGSQEEFFHTFNFLYDQRKQIVLSSDRPPHEISMLEKKLISRFEWGLVVDIQPPDFETRVAILKKKCEIKNIALDDKIIFYISEKVVDNIRVLEGFLNKIFAYSTLLNRQIDTEMIDYMYEGINESVGKVVTMDLIIDRVCEYFKISREELLSKKRFKHILIPRQIAMFLSRDLTKHSLSDIARKFGGKDHTTVLHSCKKISEMVKNESYIRGVVKNIQKNI